MHDHHYQTTINWIGNKGEGTLTLRSYDRDLTIVVPGKPEIPATSEVSIKSNKVRYNPEELLQAAVASCHMLSFLYICAQNEVVVTSYIDHSTGTMKETADGGGRFTEITLHPEIIIQGQVDEEKLTRLHHKANHICYIANSCNFPINHKPVYTFL